jgi:hypothetical protein
MAASNGGIPTPLQILLIPAVPQPGAFMYTFDPTNFNDPNSGGFYSWKVEDVACGRTPTIHRVFISYRDLGQATIGVMLSGTNDAQQVVMSLNAALAIGNASPTNKIMTIDSGIISLTAQNLQLTITRAANAGPVCITKVRMEGRVETTVY